MATRCNHTDQAQILDTKTRVCEDCVRTGDRWVHLRMCLACGHVGCCDSSKNKHATRHFRETGHPLARSIEPGEQWVWCYVDEEVAGEIVNGRLDRS
ncbi:MAG TPA: UBP-type zinc finger domain-containing protein [Candidatus Dormibacteraeota bacterium]|nr:UBP-type zinc finger domain-containing protein [Candidatus Dormibacteraeota bacterium]